MSTRPGWDTPTSGTSGDYYTLTFGDILRMLWRRLWLIALFVLWFMGMAIGYSFVETPRYETSIKILVGQAQESDTSESNLSGSDIQGLQILTKTVAEAINTRRVAKSVIEELNLSLAPGDLMDNLSVEPIPDTQFVRIKYEHPNPVRAQQIANAYGDVTSRQISEISSNASAVTATVWERAAVPDKDNLVSPKPIRNGLLALILGAMTGVIVAFLLESLDDSWRSAEEVEQISGVPTVGIIPAFAMHRGKNKKRL